MQEVSIQAFSFAKISETAPGISEALGHNRDLKVDEVHHESHSNLNSVQKEEDAAVAGSLQ